MRPRSASRSLRRPRCLPAATALTHGYRVLVTLGERPVSVSRVKGVLTARFDHAASALERTAGTPGGAMEGVARQQPPRRGRATRRFRPAGARPRPCP